MARKPRPGGAVLPSINRSARHPISIGLVLTRYARPGEEWNLLKHALEPVFFPEDDFHFLFRLSMAGQDPLPLVSRFLRKALQEGIVERSHVVGRAPTPLGHVAVLEDGRWRAFVFVQWESKTYATRYTLFPSRSNVEGWFRLAEEMGDARLLGIGESAGSTDAPRGHLTRHPRGVRWCTNCDGLNALRWSRCIWCRRALAPAEESCAPEGSTDPTTDRPEP